MTVHRELARDAEKSLAATPPNVAPVNVASPEMILLIVTTVPPAVGPEAGDKSHPKKGEHTCASAGTAILVTTGIRAAAILSARRRVIGSSNLEAPRKSSPFSSSSASATRTTSSSSGAPVVSWRILAISGIVRLPSDNFQTIAAV